MADLPSTPVDGMTSVMAVATLANPDAPKLTEINASSTLDISCYLTGDGWNPGLDEATVSDPRFCDNQTFERRGRVTRSLSITYIENPGDSVNNEAADTLVPGYTWYAIVRRGMAFDAPYAIGQKVDVWPLEAGEPSELAPEANSVFRLAQKQFVRAAKRNQVSVVA